MALYRARNDAEKVNFHGLMGLFIDIRGAEGVI